MPLYVIDGDEGPKSGKTVEVLTGLGTWGGHIRYVVDSLKL